MSLNKHFTHPLTRTHPLIPSLGKRRGRVVWEYPPLFSREGEPVGEFGKKQINSIIYGY